MNDFASKVFIAVLAFLLGLLAELIKRIFQREKRRLTYSLNSEPVIAVTDTIPQHVREKLPTSQIENITRFRVKGVNTGSTVIQSATVLVVAGNALEILQQDVATIPPRGVKHSVITNPTANELKVDDIELEKKQEICLDFFVRSRIRPDVQVFWSGGGGGVEWILGSPLGGFSLEQNLIAILRNYILAEFMPALLLGIGYFVPTLFDVHERTSWQMGGVGIGQIFGSLLRFYFYLRIVPHAVAVIRDIIDRFKHGNRPQSF